MQPSLAVGEFVRPLSQTTKLKCREENDLSKSHCESQVHHPQVTLVSSNHHHSPSLGHIQKAREQHVQELLSTNTAGIRGKLRAAGT